MTGSGGTLPQLDALGATSPHAQSRLQSACSNYPRGYATTDTALPLDAAESALEELRVAGITSWDPEREIVLDHPSLEVLGLKKDSNNRSKGAIKQLLCLGSTPLWDDLLRHAKNAAPALFDAVTSIH